MEKTIISKLLTLLDFARFPDVTMRDAAEMTKVRQMALDYLAREKDGDDAYTAEQSTERT